MHAVCPRAVGTSHDYTPCCGSAWSATIWCGLVWTARVGAAGYVEVWTALADAEDERTLVQIVGAPALGRPKLPGLVMIDHDAPALRIGVAHHTILFTSQ